MGTNQSQGWSSASAPRALLTQLYPQKYNSRRNSHHCNDSDVNSLRDRSELTDEVQSNVYICASWPKGKPMGFWPLIPECSHLLMAKARSNTLCHVQVLTLSRGKEVIFN